MILGAVIFPLQMTFNIHIKFESETNQLKHSTNNQLHCLVKNIVHVQIFKG